MQGSTRAHMENNYIRVVGEVAYLVIIF